MLQINDVSFQTAPLIRNDRLTPAKQQYHKNSSKSREMAVAHSHSDVELNQKQYVKKTNLC